MTAAAALAAGALAFAPAGFAAADPGDEISGRRARATVERLAALGPRVAGSTAERRAGALVARRLRDLGYRVGTQRVRLPGGGGSRNVVALGPGRPRVIVAAHLDGVAGGRAANDNASGVAAALEVARALRGRRGVMVVALGAEERVQTGSRVHLGAARLVEGLGSGRRNIRAAIVLDMVGVGSWVAVRGLADSPSPLARDLVNRGRALGLRSRYLPDAGLSDHRELALAGTPAAWIQRRREDCWHRACDTAERVSAAALAEAARLAASSARAALSRASTPATPG